MPAPVNHDFRIMVRTEERGGTVPGTEELRVYFSRFGHVIDCYIPKNHPYMAFCTLSSEVELRAALVDDRPFLCGVQVNLNHRPKGGPNDRSHLGPGGGPDQMGMGGMGMGQPQMMDQMGGMGGMGMGLQQGVNPNFMPLGGQQPQQQYALVQGGGGDGGGSRRLYVTQLNETINEDMLRMYFGYFGPVLDAYIPTDNTTGQRRPYAYVTMSSAHDAMKVMQLPSHQITEHVRIMACLAEPEGQVDVGGGMGGMSAYGMGGMDSMGGGMGGMGGMGMQQQPMGMGQPMLAQAPFAGNSMIKQGVLGDHRLHVFGMPQEVNGDHLRGHFARHGEILDIHVPPEKPDCAYVTFSTQEELLDALAYSGTRIAGIMVQGLSDASPRATAREGHSAPY